MPDNGAVRIPPLLPARSLSPSRRASSFVRYSRIENCVSEIDEQVEADENRGRQDDDGFNDRIVTIVNRLYGETPNTGPRKYRLRDDRAGQQRAELETDHRDDRKNSV